MSGRLGVPRFLGNGMVFAICVIVGLAWVAFRGCALPPITAEQRLAEKIELAEQQARWVEEREKRDERAPFDLALYIISHLVVLVLVTGAGAGLLTTLTLKGWAWACQIRPTGGLFPVILSKAGGQWQVHDPNKQVGATTRLGTGAALVAPGWELAQLAATAGAQHVQAEQARSYNVQVNQAQAPAAAPAGDAAPVVWPSSVGLADLLQRQGGASLDKIILGVSPGDSGEWELVNPAMSRMVHVACGGSSGWGKSTMLHSILAQFVLAGGVGLALADASGSALGQWRDCNLLQWPLATDGDEITALFVEMGAELERRAGLYAQAGNPNNLGDYNKRRGDLPALEPLALVADEANSILKANPAASAAAESLAYRGRKYGLWLVISGQRWTADEIPPGLKGQLSTRLAFKMMSKAQSNNLLLSGDAADLNDIGRGWAVIPGRPKVQFQAPIIGDAEIAALLTGHTGARQPAPVVVQDVTSDKKTPMATLSANERAYALELAEQGLTTTAIQKEIWGPNGKSGPRARAIDDLLGRGV